ncbi:acyl-CoA thioesterase [Dyadobacter sp. CY327]|uniref:acyl-CoA thioesterase n=1 Tax=Dyadobacter sp. CY327 TaxID=2907301 RepID=UPI001F18ED27|nr:acyl-CoA thioesterase [Dyadobacter sp. CY327]MCE7069312.1 acyl-CoA thioesterase [Dyadobacter sp. CY327]
MIPSYANFGGKIHGGILLSLIDKVAYACAARHAGTYCVTVSVDGVDFLEPVEVGDLVSLHASVNFVGRTSLVIGIRVIAENVRNGTQRHTNTSYVTMVAKGDDDKPTVVPELLLENEDDARRFLEAIKRRELKENYKDAFDNAKTRMDVQDNLHKLSKQRCVIGWDTEKQE